MFEYVDMSNKFSEVKAYIADGLPKEHWMDMNKARNNDGSRQGLQKVWFDTNNWTSEHKYDQYHNVEVKYAARFRDGLVADEEVYQQFSEDFCYSYWAEEYKKHSEVVYRHLRGTTPIMYPLCSVDAHTTYQNSIFCSKSSDQIELMQFHMQSLEGYQSQRLMRDKVLSVLSDDIQKLPKCSSKERSTRSQVKYIHALAVVLYTIVNQRVWIETKVYSSQDFDHLFDATARVQNVMSMLMKDETFDDINFYKAFISYNELIRIIDQMNNRWVEMFETEGNKKKRFFSSSFLTKISSMEQSLILKFGEVRVESGVVDRDEGNEDERGITAGAGEEEKNSERKDGEVDTGRDNDNSFSSSALIGLKRKHAST